MAMTSTFGRIIDGSRGLSSIIPPIIDGLMLVFKILAPELVITGVGKIGKTFQLFLRISNL